MWALSRRDGRRPAVALAAASTLLFAGIAAASSQQDPETERVATTERPTGSTTTATRNATTTTASPATAAPPTTTPPEAERKGDDANPGALYPDRPGGKKTDHEQVVGNEPVRFAGWSVWVPSTEFVDRPGQFSCCGYLRLRVRILNRDQGDQTWNRTDFSIQSPAGEVYSPAVFVAGSGGTPLGINGGLVHGGVAEGDVWFHVGDRRGKFFVLWEPQHELSNQGRGVWSVTV